jgi:hypothetical protein
MAQIDEFARELFACMFFTPASIRRAIKRADTQDLIDIRQKAKRLRDEEMKIRARQFAQEVLSRLEKFITEVNKEIQSRP